MKPDLPYRLERIFLLVAAIFGVTFALAFPPFQAPDESSHMVRAYQISEFRILTPKNEAGILGDYIPESLIKTMGDSMQDVAHNKEKKVDLGRIIGLFGRDLNPEKRVFFPVAMALYSPVPYLPQTAAMLLGRMIELPPLVIMYLGRFLNLAVWMLLVLAAIRALPFFKYVFLLLAMSPLSIHLAASLSADALTSGIAFLFIATVLRIAYGESRTIGRTDLILLFVLAGALSLCKQVYVLLIFIFLLIPAEKFGPKRPRAVILALLFLWCEGLNMGWFLAARGMMEASPFIQTKELISPHQQAAFIIAQPLSYIKVLVNTLISKQFYHVSFIGKLGWLDLTIPYTLIYMKICALVFFGLADSRKDVSVRPAQKMLVLAVFAAVFLLIITILYCAWTPVGAPEIRGVQGRYFIPISPLFMLLLYNHFFSRHIPIGERLKCICALAVICSSMVVSTIFVIYRYYGI